MTLTIFELNEASRQVLWRPLVFALQRAGAVAIDCELSGLGLVPGRPPAADLNDRYTQLKQAAESRALLSLGICCVEELPPRAAAASDSPAVASAAPYALSVFDVVVASQACYVVEPTALRFLVRHGFDFNRQVRHGLAYHPTQATCEPEPGPGRLDKKAAADTGNSPSSAAANFPQLLFKMLLDKQRPLVLHNGWIDLVFLYHHLFAALPPTLDSFLACLADIMPCVVDTKYLAEFAARENASFLEYLYRKMQRRQMRLPDDSSLQLLPAPGENALSLAAHAVQAVTKLDLTPCRSDSNDKKICRQYANYGFCAQSDTCPDSHNLEDVLDEEEGKGRKGRSQPINDSPAAKKPREASTLDSNRSATSQGHRAGFDAYMTAYVYLNYLQDRPADVKASANKIYVTGKPRPLLIEKSKYADVSAQHRAAKAAR